MNFVDFTKIVDLLSYNQYDPMLFGTSLFMFLFIGFLGIYLLISSSNKLQVAWLIIFSFFFYYKVSGIYIFLLLMSAVLNYVFGEFLRTSNKPLNRRIILVLSIVLNIGVLALFKYFDFFLEIGNSNNLFTIDPMDVILPLGISFFTFKSMNFVFDYYYEIIEDKYTFPEFLLFVSYFPNTLAGPIDRAREFLPQIRERNPITNEVLGKAVLLISLGLIKKYAIADYISLNFVDRVFDMPTRFTGAENLLAVYGYTLQIFCDFSGYTDMAIGISLLLGFKLMDNFNYPFKAKSVADFWRRWHISLSTWLQEYLFKPIQMSVRNLRIWGNVIAILITFILCGVWHGPTWGFVFWGFLHAFFMSFSLLTKSIRTKFFSLIGLNNTKLLAFFQIFFTFHLIAFAFVYFRASTFEAASEVFNQILDYFHPGVLLQFVEGYRGVFVIMVIGYVIHFLPSKLYDYAEKILVAVPLPVKALILGVVIYFVAQMKSADLQPFIYFQF